MEYYIIPFYFELISIVVVDAAFTSVSLNFHAIKLYQEFGHRGIKKR